MPSSRSGASPKDPPRTITAMITAGSWHNPLALLATRVSFLSRFTPCNTISQRGRHVSSTWVRDAPGICTVFVFFFSVIATAVLRVSCLSCPILGVCMYRHSLRHLYTLSLWSLVLVPFKKIHSWHPSSSYTQTCIIWTFFLLGHNSSSTNGWFSFSPRHTFILFPLPSPPLSLLQKNGCQEGNGPFSPSGRGHTTRKTRHSGVYRSVGFGLAEFTRTRWSGIPTHMYIVVV